MTRKMIGLFAVHSLSVLALPAYSALQVVDELNLAMDTNALVNVESGDTLCIDRITGSRGTITKTGLGILRIKLNRNKNARFLVQEGRICFDRQMPAVCAKAAFHVDSSRMDTLVTEEVNGTNFVVRWNDVRGNGMFATNCLYEQTWRHDARNRRAFISDVKQNGLPVIDFGPMLFKAYTNELGQAKGYGAAMSWSKAVENIYEVYEVISDTPDVATIAVENPQFYDKDGIVDDYIPYLLKHLKLFCQEICFVSNGDILSGKDKIITSWLSSFNITLSLTFTPDQSSSWYVSFSS